MSIEMYTLINADTGEILTASGSEEYINEQKQKYEAQGVNCKVETFTYHHGD